MGYTVVTHSNCQDCGGRTVQLMLDEDENGDDDWAGIGWFHIVGKGKVDERCPLTTCRHCPHDRHDGLCLVLVDPPGKGQARCACVGR